MKKTETFVGPCSKFVAGQGWTTEIPVEQIETKGYTKTVKEICEMIGEKTCKNISEMHPVDGFTCSECGTTIVDYVEERVDEEYNTTYHEYVFKYCPNCGAKVVE